MVTMVTMVVTTTVIMMKIQIQMKKKKTMVRSDSVLATSRPGLTGLSEFLTTSHHLTQPNDRVMQAQAPSSKMNFPLNSLDLLDE